MLTRSTEASCFFIFSSFSLNFCGSSSASTACIAPPSSSSYHCLSSLASSNASISASAAIFFAISSVVVISSVIEAYCRSLSSLFLIPLLLAPASSSCSFFTALLPLLPLKKTGWPTGVFFCASFCARSCSRLSCSRRAFEAAQRSALEARPPGPSDFVPAGASRLLLRAPPLRAVLGFCAPPFRLSPGPSEPSLSLLTASLAAAAFARASRAAAALVGPISASGSSSSPIAPLGPAAALSCAFRFAILSRPRADVRERAWKGTAPAPSRLRMPPSVGRLAPRVSGPAGAASSISTRFWMVMKKPRSTVSSMLPM
mmetsp:Transcript_48160/g.142142  ORF Transcript_48160/g.142142 Transcript_48160/m.142142 type:complete len:315 (+) Transcript_48160:2365-3309(+)